MPPPLKLLITLLSPVVVPLRAEAVMMAIQAAAALVASKLLPARLLPFKPMLLPLVRAAPARLMDQILSLLQQHQQAAVEALKVPMRQQSADPVAVALKILVSPLELLAHRGRGIAAEMPGLERTKALAAAAARGLWGLRVQATMVALVATALQIPSPAPLSLMLAAAAARELIPPGLVAQVVRVVVVQVACLISRA